MNIQFTDIYGQHVTVHDETASGNIRIKVNTLQNLNAVRATPKDECTHETDILINQVTLDLLIATLNAMNEAGRE
jgi:hypothetical protein